MRTDKETQKSRRQTTEFGRMLFKASAIPLLAVSAAAFVPSAFGTAHDTAWAQSHSGGNQGGQGGGHDDTSGHSSGGSSGGNGKGPQAGGSAAGAGGQASGQGQGAPDPDSDGRGPKYGTGSATAGGKPIWAQEGIPDVELGRLNVARSPDHVLQLAYDEALATLTATPSMIDFYNLSLADAITELSVNFDNVTFIDSPLQNLALLKDALDGTSTLTSLGVTSSLSTLEAIFLGAASDKTVPITTDTVFAVTTILGYDLTLSQASSLATDAEAVRIAILAGHG